MRDLVFIVEGSSEERFISRCVIPYLTGKEEFLGRMMNAQKITTSRKKNISGGNISFAYFRNEVRNTAARGNVLITSMLDFYRLPHDFPGFVDDSLRIDDIQAAIRSTLSDIVDPRYFYPYIQRHELEALMFSNMDGFNAIVDDDKQLVKLQRIVDEFGNPEDIDNGQLTAPSKRLMSIFGYEKVSDSYRALSEITIPVIRERCPRFDEWISIIENALKTDRFL